MIPCPQCNEHNAENHKFCLSCGHLLHPPGASAAEAFAQSEAGPLPCGSCGQVNPAGFKFCGSCGHGLRGSDVALAPTVAPPHARASAAPSGLAGAGPAAAGGPAHGLDGVHRARLILLREDGREGGALTLEGGPQTIGRNHGPPFDDDAFLDPDHAAVTATAQGLLIDDLGSLNGVFMRLRERVPLHHGDQFRVGQELLQYEDLPEPSRSRDGAERLGSPNPGYWGRACVMAAPGRPIRAQAICGEGITIGRESGEFEFPDDGYVSASHCRIVGDDHGVYLEDLGSSNGTYIRVRRQQTISLGSLLLVGQQLFRLEGG